MRFLGYFRSHVILLLLFSLTIEILSTEEQFCDRENNENCVRENNPRENNKYSKKFDKRYEKYLNAIEEAENVSVNAVECSSKKNCACFKNVVKNDLKTFKKFGISKDVVKTARTRGILYQIINGRLYREKDCMFPSRCAGIEYFILSVIDDLPNMDFVVNTRDYPQSSKHFGGPLPVFSFSKTVDYYDITYPAWSFWEGGPAISLYPRGLGRWDLHRISLDKASKKLSWNNKINKGFFRGSRTSSERDNLVLLSRNKPEIVDASYTKNQAWKSEADTLNLPPADETSLESHCDYKYLFNFRGVAASFRHKHLFLCRSLVFHVGDEWKEFYYDAMKPWLHYIPVRSDASEEKLQELINFAKDNDDIVRRIAKRGRDFIWDNLRMSDIKCFWKYLLNNYAKLLSYEPTLEKTLIEIISK